MKSKWLLAPSLVILAFAAACGDDDYGGSDDDGVVLGTTPEDTVTGPALNPPGDDLDGAVRQNLERVYGIRDWVDDVEDIEKDGDKLLVKLDRDFEEDQTDFEDLCAAVLAQVKDTDLYHVEEVAVTDADDREVMRARADDPECEPVER